MPENPNVRQERIGRLLKELEYEIVRGTLEGDLDEHWHFQFYVPLSRKIPDGVVRCIFEVRPIPRYQMNLGDLTPRLKVVKS